ncbi:MAG: hypothetical protein LAQ30_03835 [Acidobacteriia bacterium]|nr:hypothetical protein [Terriglobia bacterium]
MHPHTRKVLIALCAAAAWATPAGAQRWRIQYEFDEVRSSLAVADLQFSSPARGVAVGLVLEGGSNPLRSAPHDKPVALVTADGGAHWQTVSLKERPVSVFFLNDSLGWLVTDKGLWQTSEAGKDWTKLPKPPGRILRVYFTDHNNGWAACADKKVLATQDGGKHWEVVRAASEQPGDPNTTVYGWIAFANPKLGLITGWNVPQRYERFAEWLDPGSYVDRRETPHLSLSLQTSDAGLTWKSFSSSMFGQITRVRFGPLGKGLGLVEHSSGFQYPSEVFRILWPTGKSELLYRDRTFFISDVWVTPGGVCYLAGTEANSRLRNVVPQKVKVLKSQDLKEWTAMPVDYRAVANRVVFAGQGENDLWLATNNGMILKLTP